MTVEFGFKAIKPIKAEHPLGSGIVVSYEPGDEVPASEWGRAAGNLVESGKIMRYARNVDTVGEDPAVSTPAPVVDPDTDEDEDGEPVADENSPFPRNEGGGWYRLSDGERIRGKVKAFHSQAVLDQDAPAGSTDEEQDGEEQSQEPSESTDADASEAQE